LDGGGDGFSWDVVGEEVSGGLILIGESKISRNGKAAGSVATWAVKGGG
jgi:hypothetical protein